MFGTFSTKNYGPTEVKILENENFIEEVEVKIGTNVRHGRCLRVYKVVGGPFWDCFWKDDKNHGPGIAVSERGWYQIQQWEEGERVSS